MPALVRADGDAVGIFLHRRTDNFGHRAVMAQVNNFDTQALQNAAHDVDGGIVPIEQTGSGNETQWGDLAGVGHGRTDVGGRSRHNGSKVPARLGVVIIL